MDFPRVIYTRRFVGVIMTGGKWKVLYYNNLPSDVELNVDRLAQMDPN